MNRWKDKWIDGWKEGKMDGWKEGAMEGKGIQCIVYPTCSINAHQYTHTHLCLHQLS